jgi:uncharacterized membrane protein YciS (DUF1049 family)
MKSAVDRNTYLFGITSANFAYLSFIAIIFFVIAGFALCKIRFIYMYEGKVVLKVKMKIRRMKKITKKKNEVYMKNLSAHINK